MELRTLEKSGKSIPEWVCETHLREIDDLETSGEHGEAREMLAQVIEDSWCPQCKENKEDTVKLTWTGSDRVKITIKGTARACWYYYTVREGAYRYRAGRYIFGREIDYTNNGTPYIFPTAKQARAYCEAKDANAVILTSQS